MLKTTDIFTPFTAPIDIHFYDCDVNKKARISTIMKIVADVASVDFTIKGFSHDFLVDNDMAFLLSKVTIDIKRPIHTDEQLIIKTYPHAPSGSTFTRDVVVFDKCDNIIAQSATSWLLVSPTTRKILRPTSFTDKFDVLYAGSSPCTTQVHNKISYAENDLVHLGAHHVRFSDIDGNHHVYNAFYGDIIYDFLPSELAVLPMKEFKITYKREAILGDIIDLFISSIPSSDIDTNKKNYIIVGKVDNKVCFESEITI